MACSFCRRRKLRCDGVRPACSACKRLDRSCEYNNSIQARGSPKRYGREVDENLISRTASNTLAPTSSSPPNILAAVDAFAIYNNYTDNQESDANDITPEEPDSPRTPFGYSGADTAVNSDDDDVDGGYFELSPIPKFPATIQTASETDDFPLLDEPAKAELTDLFFQDVYPTYPIIHQSRYYASLKLSPSMQPPLCLRYVMWALAAVQHEKWEFLSNSLYEKSRKLLEQDEQRGGGTEALNVAHVQCWSLIAAYESYMLLSLRTWSSIRRASALAHLLRLHTMDEPDESPSPLLPESNDPSELEERRRAFWSAFTSDRWISSSTGYPMTITDTKITTKLPSSEDAFNSGVSESTQSLGGALEAGFDPNTSVHGARAVFACALGRVMQHVGSESNADSVNKSQQFWKQHTILDNLLLKMSQTRPAALRPSSSTTDAKLWAFDMWLHGLIICLHQAAMDRAMKEDGTKQITQSFKQCRDAANNIISSARSTAHIEVKKIDPFTASCVYMAGSVLIRARKHGESRSTDIEDLRFVQQALQHMYQKTRTTEIFITQFKEDLAKSGISLMITPADNTTASSRKRISYFGSEHRRCPSDSMINSIWK